MNKILIIIQREYFSRVKKRSFVVLTILVPVLFIGMFALIGYLAVKGNELGDKKKIMVIDENGLFKNNLKNSAILLYTYSNESYEIAKKNLPQSGYDYILHIPASLKTVEIIGEKKPSAITIGDIQDELSNVAESQRLIAAGIDTAMLAKARMPVTIQAKLITEAGEKDAQTYIAYAIGFASAFLIYMCLFIYGVQVMRGVIEEKVSRIIEVIISSVKPFQLMLGKIIGVGLVGLTQFVLWIVLTIVLSTVAGTALMKNNVSVQTVQMAQSTKTMSPDVVAFQQSPQNGDMGKVLQSLSTIPFGYIIFCFLFYFLSGYFLYSAIFAAVGSAVDSETETQQFMLPITLPLVFTFILSMNFIINNPDSSLAVWLSMIPFTSPIAMMIRVPFGVPVWQLVLSMFFMVIGFLFTTWVAARIYRVGILMYGKKASYKELAKWFMYKG